MIVAVGTDLVDAGRIADAMRRTGGAFARRVLGPSEQDAPDHADEAALAARFALKEACLKALGTGWASGLAFTQVEVADPVTAPRIELTGAAAEQARRLGADAILATVTVRTGRVLGMVILQGRGRPEGEGRPCT